MQINKNLLTWLFCALFSTGYAQKNAGNKLSGTVKSSDGHAIEAVSILLSGQQDYQALSDKDGHYQFIQVKPGNYTLKVSATGHLKLQKPVTISGPSAELDLTLQTAARNLNDVLITGQTKSQELKQAGFAVNAIELKKYGNSTADLNQVLSRSSGINIREQGGLGSDFKFSVNGLSGKQVKFFLDGIPMENFGNSLTLNNIPVNLAERIEVYKGAVPTHLGADALGGAVNIVTNQGLKQYLDASYSVGSFHTHRAALAGRYTDPKTGWVIDLNGYYNFSANNYLMRNSEKYDAAIRHVVGEGDNQTYEYVDSKRFHDDYESVMGKADIGFTGKKWADLFKIGFLYANQHKEIQTLATQESIVGAADKKSNFFLPSIRYRKDNLLLKGLNLSLFASYARDNSQITDTSRNVYDWAGRVYKSDNTAGEFNRDFSIYHYKNSFGLGQLNLDYAINAHHALQLNYNVSLISRKGYDELDPTQSKNAFNDPNTINKHVAGLSWQSAFFDDRLSTSIFGKYYGFRATVREVVNYTNGVGLKTDSRGKQYNYYGAGIATRYKLSKRLGVKFSAEHAYRLQDAEELFGDGIAVLSNPNLEPEESNNFNFGAYYTHTAGKHQLSAEAAGFLRKAKNFIYYISNQTRYSIYTNEMDVDINGLESSVEYTYNKLVHAGLNLTYQNARRSNGYKDRVPNQPYLLGNADLSIMKDDLIGKGTNITLSWFGQYIKDYFLSWPGQGTVDTKIIIPTQLIHNASLSCSFDHNKYNVSAEVRNITNRLAYDDFKLQKPGRAAYLKFRYLIK
ncbi:TonB-dependent receptor [Pedobacter sp. AW31-3R]|uniref:TonB-dependent receptor n=1 Tax=Pedobacter sp. AW31-3R TaxID=3445781 RepID=UPI003FA01FE5